MFVWTKEKCLEEALKYKTKKEFEIGSKMRIMALTDTDGLTKYALYGSQSKWIEILGG